MRIYCCQSVIEWENKRANFQHVRDLLSSAKVERGSLVLLPEMFATGFSMNVPAIAESDTGETDRFVSELARELGATVVAGLVRKSQTNLGENQAIVVGPDGREIVRYSKMHPFTFGEESKHYGRGNDIALFDWQGVKVMPIICYDLRFPEIFRDGVSSGVQLFCVIANWPAVRQTHWATLLRARAIENQAYVAGVNRWGSDPNNLYGGGSMIVDPRGVDIAEVGEGERVISAEINVLELVKYRAEFPALKDMHLKYRAH